MKRIFIAQVFLMSGLANADYCPTPATAIEPSVKVSVSYDKKTKLYTYKYGVANGQSSLLSLSRFTLASDKQPVSTAFPKNWFGKFYDGVDQPNVSWDALPQRSDITSVPKKGPNSDITRIASAIQPGRNLEGFSIQSYSSPGIAQFFAEGFAQMPAATGTEEDDEPTPNCPGWDFESPRAETLVNGITIGPQADNQISVRVRLRDSSGTRPCEPINPNSPAGNVTVLVLSTRDFDASQIPVSSITFGPDRAKPLSAKIIGVNDRDFDSNSKEEWEGIAPPNDLKGGRSNLLLTFDKASLGVRCVLDRALLLKATMPSGATVLGGVSAKTIGCDVHKPGVRRHKARKER
jgi:hypothetical protein